MKIHIVGDKGAFGSFLKELLAPHFTFDPSADSVILAVAEADYDQASKENAGKHLINVCSVQSLTTKACLRHSNRVTSIHPLFGRRTPVEFRNSVHTYSSFAVENDLWFKGGTEEEEFLNGFSQVSKIYTLKDVTPEAHDAIMKKTHYNAMLAAMQMKVFVDQAKDVPDYLIPHSFRLLRNFVKTLDDMPAGTLQSILANPNV